MICCDSAASLRPPGLPTRNLSVEAPQGANNNDNNETVHGVKRLFQQGTYTARSWRSRMNLAVHGDVRTDG